MSLIVSRRFTPLFVTQFFGAFNDNFMKNALVILVAYKMAHTDSEIGLLSNLAAALFILPYFLFSAFAGQLADRFERSILCRYVKLWEILLMIAAAAGFMLHSETFLLVLLALMGLQSTFFGPLKYALLPQLLPDSKELLQGNAWIEGGTYLAILAGTIGGSLLICRESGELLCGIVLILFALAGYIASRKIPVVPVADPQLNLDFRLLRQTWRLLRDNVWAYPTVKRCIISVSMFWLAGSLYVTQTPLLVKKVLCGDEKVCTFLFILFSLGVGCGTAVAGWMFRKCSRSFDRRLLYSIVGMGCLTLCLAFLKDSGGTAVLSLREMFHIPAFYALSILFFLIAVCGGIWSVPVQTLMQIAGPKEMVARVIAGNNIINSFYMAAGALVTAILLEKEICSVQMTFVILGILILLAAVYSIPLVKKADVKEC